MQVQLAECEIFVVPSSCIKQTPSQIEVCLCFYQQVRPTRSEVGHLFTGILVYISSHQVKGYTNTVSVASFYLSNAKQSKTKHDLQKCPYLNKVQ